MHLVENPLDQTPMPDGFARVAVSESPIHGKGLFATRRILTGEIIAPARIAGKRTPAGRYTNHSCRSNSTGARRSDSPDSDIDMYAISDIEAGMEILIDYRHSLDVGGSGLLPRKNLIVVASHDAEDAALSGYLVMPRGEQITSLIADLMSAREMEPPPVKHTFCNGMYMRELFIPKHTLLAGKLHKVTCLNICSSGDIDIATEHGSVRVGAGFTAASPAFTQKLGYAYEDTVWVNIFRTDETDIGKLERDLFFSDAEMIDYLDPSHRHFKFMEKT